MGLILHELHFCLTGAAGGGHGLCARAGRAGALSVQAGDLCWGRCRSVRHWPGRRRVQGAGVDQNTGLQDGNECVFIVFYGLLWLFHDGKKP